MSDAMITLEQVLKKAGLTAKWEADGGAEKARNIARNMLRDGFTHEQTARLSELEIGEVATLAKAL